jgi:UDP-N-acetylmuramoylalanine--D-glutamate ligase
MLNIDEAHLDRHRTIAEYVRIKSRIFMNHRPGDALILNFDDPRLRPLARKHQGKTFFVSNSQEVDRGAWLIDGIAYLNVDGVIEEIGPAIPPPEPRALARADVPFPENLLSTIVAARVSGIEAGQIANAVRRLCDAPSCGHEPVRTLGSAVRPPREADATRGRGTESTHEQS